MTRLEDALKEYAASGALPMHMPGHKRNPGLVPSYLLNDITEITGFDNLHAPSGVLKSLEVDAAALWGAKSAVLSVNGATAPILASIMAASSLGKILIASNCHISVWHALELAGCDYSIIDPDTDPDVPFFMSVDASKVEAALASDPAIKAIVITSPSYEGIVSDVAAVVKAAHAHGVAVIVDESHGSHFGLNDYFPATSVADVVIKSIHKTLHSPTQTALLLTYSDMIREDLIRHYMNIFESSSPSYILMSGIDRVVRDLKEDSGITNAWVDALKSCRGMLRDGLQHLKLYEHEGADPSKLVILTAGVVSGQTLFELLQEKGVECEVSYETHLIAMTGIGDNEESLGRFAEALVAIDAALEGEVVSCPCPYPSSAPVIATTVTEAVRAEFEEVPVSECEGRVSASYVFKYPPGIPVLIPGQVITGDRAALIPDAVDIIKLCKVQYRK